MAQPILTTDTRGHQTEAPVPSGIKAQLRQLLSRETASGRFIPEIDGLRFVAIASVVFFHTFAFMVPRLGPDAGNDPLAQLMSKGGFGVQLFFTISGFIISLPFAQAYRGAPPLPRLRDYYLRRLTRLEPPYVINLVLITALRWGSGRLPLTALLPHLLCSLTYTHTLAYGEASTINLVAWSLEVECQFYLLAPLFAKVFAVSSVRQRRLLLGAGIVLSECVAQYLLPQTPRWRLSLPAQLSYFLCGYLLADLYVRELAQQVRRSRAWDVIGLLCWLLMLGILLGPKSLRVLLPVPLVLAYYAAFSGPWSQRLFGNRYIYTIGGMCYTIYLYHTFLIAMGGSAVLRLPGVAQLPVWLCLSLATLVIVPLILLVCTVLFAVTEKPFMRRNWPAKLQSRWSALSFRRPA